MQPSPPTRPALLLSLSLSLLCGGCGGDPCAQAAAQLDACGDPLPATFLTQCRAHAEVADALLVAGCPPRGRAGKADGHEAPQVPPVKANRLELDTESKTLVLYRVGDGDPRELARFRVGLGLGEYLSDEGKQRQGDRRTPRGRYRLFAARASKYLRFLHVSYPNAEDAARGLAAGLITRAEHDAIVAATRTGRPPPQDTALGGDIGLHGFGEELGFVPPRVQRFQHLVNVTQGCVLLTDEEILVLEQSYVPGSALEIR